MTAIDRTRIDAMVAQLRAAAAQTTPQGAGRAAGIGGLRGPSDGVLGAGSVAGSSKTSFSDALKSSLDQVNSAQLKADNLGQKFAAGDDSVNLSDVMIAAQKANIGLQATIQVRNKLVSAYHDIMNMQI